MEKKMSCRGSLEYTCPSHGGWGMVRIGMLIPESHQLFVCPSACGRHGALGAIQKSSRLTVASGRKSVPSPAPIILYSAIVKAAL